MEALFEMLESLLIHGRPYHPQSQGHVERFNRTFKEMIQLLLRKPGMQLEEAVRLATLFYNSRIVRLRLSDCMPHRFAVGFFGFHLLNCNQLHSL